MLSFSLHRRLSLFERYGNNFFLSTREAEQEAYKYLILSFFV